MLGANSTDPSRLQRRRRKTRRILKVKKGMLWTFLEAKTFKPWPCLKGKKRRRRSLLPLPALPQLVLLPLLLLVLLPLLLQAAMAWQRLLCPMTE